MKRMPKMMLIRKKTERDLSMNEQGQRDPYYKTPNPHQKTVRLLINSHLKTGSVFVRIGRALTWKPRESPRRDRGSSFFDCKSGRRNCCLREERKERTLSRSLEQKEDSKKVLVVAVGIRSFCLKKGEMCGALSTEKIE
jgi:hypothetical protein